MTDFERLGVFYLGRASDPAGTVLGEPVLYDSRHLVTHALCVGMTGSGKTGLCLSLIEEAALDGVPTIAIDPKGDLSNLLLTFPKLAPADFRPWIDEDEARRAGLTPEAYAAQQAGAWAKGLAEWGQDGARIERLRASADFAIYTPGSRAGRPLSILSSFKAPPSPSASARQAPASASARQGQPSPARGGAAGGDEAESLAERASTTARGVLTLAGVEVEERGREHTFIAALLAAGWKAGRDLDLGALIQGLQSPPFETIGVLDVDAFYPANERFTLATKLNAVLASPGFEQWLEGEPLDPGRLLYGPAGKPRVSIVSIAHLDEARRMFFVSLLLNEIVAWMRRQSGTSSLRAIVYMDEIAGYFPPVATPPAKAPLLTLLKQGRAFGVGVVLATQNTVDLDYKGLGNTGTWLLGRLQTERDKARVLDGLEGAAGGSIDREAADKALSALGKRVFLLHDVHAAGAITFQSRWAMSYLRGPLSREQIRTLTATDQAATDTNTTGDTKTPAAERPGPARIEETSTPGPSSSAPILAPGVSQCFVPAGVANPRYTPVVLGIARVTFADAKLNVNETRAVVALAPIGSGPVPVEWEHAEVLDLAPSELESSPAEGATFDPLPKPAAAAKSYAGWQKSFAAWIARSQTLDLHRHADLKLVSKAGESERDFRIRAQGAQREARDTEVDLVRRTFAEKRARAEEKLRKAEQGVSREQEQASSAKVQTAVSMGAAVLGVLLGRKTLSAGNLGRATTAVRGAGRASSQQTDVKRAQENVDVARKALEQLDARIEEETTAIASRYDMAAAVDTVSLAPKRGHVLVESVALGWKPR